MGSERFNSMYSIAATAAVVLLVGLMATACSNSRIKRTPTTNLGTPWFCQMNETRDDWSCVQDAELARNPKPDRLPSDAVATAPAAPSPAADLPASADASEGVTGLADPAAAIDSEALPATAPEDDGAESLLSLPASGYAVQLISLPSREMADEFTAIHYLPDAITLALAREKELYYVVLLGVFPTFDEAEQASHRLPESLADTTPWIRPLKSVQDGIRQARALATASG
ncbi:MAG: SPOR domain-containing protein [Pseudomonadales bacterium]|jgi:septal ring-binding cell division protein DamX